MDGVWHGGDDKQIGAAGWEPRHEAFDGYVRAVTAGSQPDFPAEAGRYHLILCPGCPMSHRVAMVHRMKNLGNAITTSLVRPVMGPQGREFGTALHASPDSVTGHDNLHQLYLASDQHYSGRDSTPVLWDKQRRKIVSNTYRDILTMLNREFGAFTDSQLDFQPPERMAEIDEQLARLGAGFTGVVYRCGFSRDQKNYEENAALLGRTIAQLEQQLADRPFLLGEHITEPDLVLFSGLVRYDAIYLPLFKCTAERIEDSAVLTAYIKRMLQIPGIAETFDLPLTMTHYYMSHAHINPTRIVPM
ncbi:MAG: glutathione S-transferase C-terminal domain-containing protein, partial [Variovorax sp.]